MSTVYGMGLVSLSIDGPDQVKPAIEDELASLPRVTSAVNLEISFDEWSPQREGSVKIGPYTVTPESIHVKDRRWTYEFEQRNDRLVLHARSGLGVWKHPPLRN